MSKSPWAGRTQYLDSEIKQSNGLEVFAFIVFVFGNGIKMYERENRFIISIRFAYYDINGSLAEHRIYHAHNY